MVKSEPRLFFDEIDGMPERDLADEGESEGAGLPSRTCNAPGAGFLRRLSESMMGMVESVVNARIGSLTTVMIVTRSKKPNKMNRFSDG